MGFLIPEVTFLWPCLTPASYERMASPPNTCPKLNVPLAAFASIPGSSGPMTMIPIIATPPIITFLAPSIISSLNSVPISAMFGSENPRWST